MKKNRYLLLVTLLCLLLLAVENGAALEGAARGAETVVTKLLPSSLPFMILAHLTATYAGGTLLPALLVGNLSGYPSGGSLCVRLADENRLNTVLLFVSCVGAGPGFTLSAVGSSLLGLPRAGILLYAAQLLTSLTAAFPLLFRRKNRTVPLAAPPFAEAFLVSVKESSLSFVTVGGTVIFFSCVLSAAESGIKSVNGISGMVLFGLCEITSGAMRAERAFGAAGLTALGFLLGFGGLSVLCQLFALAENSGIRKTDILLARLLSAALGGGYTLLLVRLFPSYAQTAALGVEDSASIHPLPLAFTLCALTVALLLSDRRTATVRFSPLKK